MRTYAHAKHFEPTLLVRIGLGRDMQHAFKQAGWNDFDHITEQGSYLFSIESNETSISFRFFNEDFTLSAGQFSLALGFHKKCFTNPNILSADHQYERMSWWGTISTEPYSVKNSIISIHNPTLQFLAKWIAMVVHSRSDLRLCFSYELQCLYALAKKIKYSPVLSMLTHWQNMITAKTPIDITSLVTRVATYVGALNNAQLTYLPMTEEYQTVIGLEHFIQGHMLRKGLGGSLFMCYHGYEEEVELPCPTLALYSARSLTLQMQKEQARRSVATRGQTSRAAQA
ncbi:hypothetical protein PVAP13_6NG245709, partial [Panicum virgatum]